MFSLLDMALTYTVALPEGTCLTDPFLGFVMQKIQLQFEPESASMLMVSPAMCQWISSVEQDDHKKRLPSAL